MKHRTLFAAVSVSLVGVLLAASPAGAQTPAERLAREFRAIVEQVDTLVKEHAAEIKKRDDRIAELEGEIRRLAGELDKARSEILALKERKPEPEAAKEEKRALTPAFLGVSHVEPPAEVRERLNLEPATGAVIVGVYPGGPAEKAGLREGDVIIRVAGERVGSKSLESAVRSRNPGDKVPVVYFRDGDDARSEVTLGHRDEYIAALERPAQEKEPVAQKEEEATEPAPARFGILVEETEELELVIKEVDTGFTGAIAGLREGDEIQSVNGAAVKSLEDLRGAFSGIRAGDTFKIELKRGAEIVAAEAVAGAKEGEGKLVNSTSVSVFKGQPATLGVRVEERDGRLAVTEVHPHTASSAYGIAAGDIIAGANGKDTPSIDALKEALAGKVSGDSIDLVVVRGDQRLTFAGVVLGARGEAVAAPEGFKPSVAKAEPEKKEKGYLGLTAQELESGPVVISEIVDGGPSHRAGLQKEDVILKVNDVEVKTLDDVVRGLRDTYAGSTLAIGVRRGEDVVTVEVTLGTAPE